MKFPAALVYLFATCAAMRAEDSVPASLKHFEQIDREVYAGSKPHTDRDFEYLQSKHIRYIVSARFLPFLSGSETRQARRYGITVLSMPMNASPIPPTE